MHFEKSLSLIQTESVMKMFSIHFAEMFLSKKKKLIQKPKEIRANYEPLKNPKFWMTGS